MGNTRCFKFYEKKGWNSKNDTARTREKINQCKNQTCFNVGDNVLVKCDIRNKNDDRYEGPIKVSKIIHDRSYELTKVDGSKIIRNIEWLKDFKKGGC